MREFIGGIGNDRLYFREIRCHTVIDFIKGHAVMHIAGGNHGFQHKAVFVAGGMGLIGKLPLVFPFTNRPLSGSVTLRVAVRCFSFFRRASFFLEVLSLGFFLGPVARHHRQRVSFHGPDGLRLPLPSVPWRSV